MLLGVGIELVEVPRFERALSRYGDRLAQRLFTDAERAYAASRARGNQSLAVRFAAKCAARRALRSSTPGRAMPIRWAEVEVVRGTGAPTLRFHGAAAECARVLGVTHVALTLTHDRAACLAQVVLEGGAEPSP
jgi:holo-[acyl-carrier protein] synthase